MTLSQSDIRIVRGCLIVRTKMDTQLGLSDTMIPANTIGYVLGSSNDTRLVYWPHIKTKPHGVVLNAALEITGRQR